jgi:alpha-galactosidase
MITRSLMLFLTLLVAVVGDPAQTMSGPSRPSLKIRFAVTDFAVSDTSNVAWNKADRVKIDRYWSGEKASDGRRVWARLLWSKTALYALFEANRGEPLVVSDKPDLTKKAMGLWDRDVVEIFVAPEKKEPRKYFEFEVAPTGEWLDVALDLTSGTRVSDWKYSSGMESFAEIQKDRIVAAVKIPWSAFGRTPKPGDAWVGNIFRCVGTDPDRGYLAWQPTFTEKPNFHVPEKFGDFRFL